MHKVYTWCAVCDGTTRSNLQVKMLRQNTNRCSLLLYGSLFLVLLFRSSKRRKVDSRKVAENKALAKQKIDEDYADRLRCYTELRDKQGTG